MMDLQAHHDLLAQLLHKAIAAADPGSVYVHLHAALVVLGEMERVGGR